MYEISKSVKPFLYSRRNAFNFIDISICILGICILYCIVLYLFSLILQSNLALKDSLEYFYYSFEDLVIPTICTESDGAIDILVDALPLFSSINLLVSSSSKTTSIIELPFLHK